MEGFELALLVGPAGFTRRVDDEGSNYHDEGPDNQHREPHGVAAHRDLAGRYETEHEGQQGAQKSQSADEPHHAVAFAADAEGAVALLHVVPQVDGGREHEHVHDEVEHHRELRHDLVETLYRRHHDEEQTQQRDGGTLQVEDVFLYAYLVGLLEERGQIPGAAHGKDTFRRAGHPGEYTGQHTEGECDGNDRREPRGLDEVEIVVESDQQTLGEVDVFLRDDDAQRKGAQHEDEHRDGRADEYRLGVVFRGVVDVFHVDTAHLHTGIEEEDAGGQHQVVEVGEVGQEATREVHLRLAAHGQIDDGQNHQQPGRNDGTHQTAHLGHLAYPVEPLQRDEGGQPVDEQHHRQGVETVRGQQHVARVVHADEGDGHGTESQHRRVPDGTLDPLQPDGQEAGPFAEGFAHPAEHTALLVLEHGGQFGGYQRRRNEEYQGCKQIIESRAYTIFGLGRQSSQRDDRRYIHDSKREYAQFDRFSDVCHMRFEFKFVVVEQPHSCR